MLGIFPDTVNVPTGIPTNRDRLTRSKIGPFGIHETIINDFGQEVPAPQGSDLFCYEAAGQYIAVLRGKWQPQSWEWEGEFPEEGYCIIGEDDKERLWVAMYDDEGERIIGPELGAFQKKNHVFLADDGLKAFVPDNDLQGFYEELPEDYQDSEYPADTEVGKKARGKAKEDEGFPTGRYLMYVVPIFILLYKGLNQNMLFSLVAALILGLVILGIHWLEKLFSYKPVKWAINTK